MNYNGAGCTSNVPGLQGCISVGGGREGGVPSSGKLLLWLPLPKENEGPHWGLREEEQWFRMKTKTPEGQSETSTDTKFLDWEFCFRSKRTELDLTAKGWRKCVCPQFGTDSIFLTSFQKMLPTKSFIIRPSAGYYSRGEKHVLAADMPTWPQTTALRISLRGTGSTRPPKYWTRSIISSIIYSRPQDRTVPPTHPRKTVVSTLSDSTVLAKLVLWISGTLVVSISSR